ncbi:MAG: terminase large subunit [Planctomycetes bacterium]|nr:terminase large subunit [Planctomycetota bacterium]
MAKRSIPKNAQARAALDFVSNLTLVGDASGQPFKPLPFQRDILSTIFGTLDAAGRRRINRVFLMLPRKQAKTYLVACVVLYWLLGRGLKGQQCLSIANDRAQAGLLFDMCRQMLAADDELSAVTEVIPSTKRITVQEAFSYYAALSTESTTKTGFNPSLVVVDEAQDITDGDLIKNITTGRTARDDYLTFFVGTAGKRKDTPFYAEYEYAKKWLAGVVENQNYFAWVYEATEDADWTDEKVWRATMPAYGKFCRAQAVREEFELAKEMPHKEQDFRQYLLNQWQIYADGAAKFCNDAPWMLNAGQPRSDGGEYFGGLDLASVNDTSSLVLFGRNSDGKFDVLPFVWVCEEQIAKRQTAQFDYDQWRRAGFLRVTPGGSQDQEVIARDIVELSNKYRIKKVAVDRWGTNWIAQALANSGLEVVGFGQGFQSMSPALKHLQKLILDGLLCHGGHPVLRWMVSNARVDSDAAGNIKLNKSKSDEKIDGVQSLAMAVGVQMDAATDVQFGVGRSVYEDGGLLVL